MPDRKKPSNTGKLKELRPKSVSSAKAGKIQGGATAAPRDAASGLPTGKRMH
jgi:hypothetical protein